MRIRLTHSAALFVLAVLAGAFLAPEHAPAQKTPVKIGFLAPLTGGAAQIGRDMVNGFEMYLDEAGQQIGGPKVEVIVEDTAGNPATAITKMRKLVESDRVHMVGGETFAHIGYALAAKADEYQIPTIFPVIGGQVIQKLWAPLGTSDLSPYLTQIKREADAAFVVVVAASALKFPSQYQDAGLRGKLPVIGGAVITDESILPTFGDEALGTFTRLMFSAALDTPVNRKFVAEYRKRFKQPLYTRDWPPCRGC